MNGSRNRRGVLLVCTCLFAFLVFAASSAQAEEKGNWRVSGVNVTEALKPSVKLGLTAHLSFNFTVNGAKVKILCNSLTTAGALFLVPFSRLTAAALLIAGCDVSINGSKSAACAPHTAGSPEGTIKTLSLKGLLVLHEGAGVIRLEPESGETIANIVLGIEGESECAIGETLPLSGKWTVKDPEMSTELVTHTVSELEALTDLWVLKKTAEHKVTITGSILMSLSGAHAGLKWSGQPG